MHQDFHSLVKQCQDLALNSLHAIKHIRSKRLGGLVIRSEQIRSIDTLMRSANNALQKRQYQKSLLILEKILQSCSEIIEDGHKKALLGALIVRDKTVLRARQNVSLFKDIQLSYFHQNSFRHKLINQSAFSPAPPVKDDTPSKQPFFFGAIETPYEGTQKSYLLRVQGWAVSSHSEISTIQIWLSNKILGFATYGISRPDVKQTHPHLSSEFCGFEQEFNLLSSELSVPTNECSLKIIIADTAGRLQVLSRNISFPPPQSSNESNLFLTSLFKHSYGKKDEYVPIATTPFPLKADGVKTICFYLPQFHPIKENDLWWGKGFTEWSNVSRAVPHFTGHYQPHLPDELGFYDLRLPEVQYRQQELAQLYGIHAFCYYIYWFGGKRLLEAPTERLLTDKNLTMPFCLCWANENWTRRWDGQDQDVLIAQDHTLEDDLAFIKEMSRFFRLPHYLKVDGKPVFLVYRCGLLPDASETTSQWRKYCREAGLGEIYLVASLGFGLLDPQTYGFDAAVAFQPHVGVYVRNQHINPVHEAFDGTIYNYDDIANSSKSGLPKNIPVYPTVMPGWDNTARKGLKATVFAGNTPAKYQNWLSRELQYVQENLQSSEQFVFINAWNEWGEGAHLEPDRRHGYAYLEATKNALLSQASSKNKIIVVSHDAHPHGAQFLALGMVKALSQALHYDVYTVLLGPGKLTEQFEAYSSVSKIYPENLHANEANDLVHQLVQTGYRCAIVNTTVSGEFCQILAEAGILCVCLVHEMPGVIQSFSLSSQARTLAEFCHRVIFPAEIVAAGFKQFADINAAKCRIRPQGLWRRNYWRFNRAKARENLRRALHVAPQTQIVLAVGYADHRKGVDLFVKMGLEVLLKRPDTCFVWIGHWDHTAQNEVAALLDSSPYATSFRFLGYEQNTALYHAGADVYALTSREDPFPNVVLESFDAGVPVVAFAGSGGAIDLLTQLNMNVAPAGDSVIFAKLVLDLLSDLSKSTQLGRLAMDHVDRHYSFTKYLFDLCDLVQSVKPRISVVVPNYNYAKYIKARLDSIINQTIPIFELLILDDASTDDSLEQIAEWMSEKQVEARIIVNETNSKSVYTQWAKGVSAATGDYIWIAEADDLSDPNFLEQVMAAYSDESVVLSYCESKQIDQSGTAIADNYLYYVQDVDQRKWQQNYVTDGCEEITTALAIKNTIPNVSGVVFKREVLSKVFSRHLSSITSYPRAGDWLVYLEVLSMGKVSFNSLPLNIHRRHHNSVVAACSNAELLNEITSIQSLVTTRFPLSSKTLSQVQRYRDELRHQFGLNSEDEDKAKGRLPSFSRVAAS